MKQIMTVYNRSIIPLKERCAIVDRGGWERNIDHIKICSISKSGKSVELLVYDKSLYNMPLCRITKRINLVGQGITHEGAVTISIGSTAYEVGKWNEV